MGLWRPDKMRTKQKTVTQEVETLPWMRKERVQKR